MAESLQYVHFSRYDFEQPFRSGAHKNSSIRLKFIMNVAVEALAIDKINYLL
jgi:hypothetical protein